ncbi:M23 family metallopeptidase [Clostridium isatidis]|uniref:Peptidase M23 n=1 Tax=Clostridium isatidis TaxID=182773 RepID=A0A343JEU2_9CLOT|nr:M23 family metallopeptidase [Clostridium isatidis]ASW44050.1 peptidase M23 [Clostridium isatidis]NLZ34447.1 M23 family metallopeptidase [Clostridiales bacterium]
MDQIKKDKIKNFFRKEGFYLVLFLCLCIIATVTVVTVRKNNALNESSKVEDEFSLNIEDRTTSEIQKQNADRVENESNEELAENTTEELASGDDLNVSAGTNYEVVFNNPLEGEISREYTYPKPQQLADGTLRNIRGIDIRASVGTEVKAAAEGEVKEVGNKVEDGTYIVIAHANGLYTKYSNLSQDTRVNVGDKVTEETVIGTVGNTSKIFTNEEFGEHLNLQVFDSNGKDLDPTAYFTLNQ